MKQILLTLVVLSLSGRLSECLNFTIDKHQIVKTKKVEVTQSSNTCIITGTTNNTFTTIAYGNCVNNIYTINLTIGTPPQPFTVQFDTGSNTLWVPLNSFNGFNSNASSTFQISTTPQTIQYGSGSQVVGLQGSDIVRIPGTHISVGCPILWVTQQSANIFPSPIIGIVGMGHTTTPNFLDQAYYSNQISSPLFSLHLALTPYQSYLYYNDIPSNYYLNSIWIDVYGGSQGFYWAGELIGFYSGSNDLTSSAASQAVIDSGTSLLAFNTALYNNLISELPSSCLTVGGSYACPCSGMNSWPKLSIMMAGVEVYIYPSNYSTPFVDGYCFINFQQITGNSQIILGDIFFRNYVITFDKLNSQIGFYGQTTLVQVIGGSTSTNNPSRSTTPDTSYFLDAQYAMLAILIAIQMAGIFLVYWLRLTRDSRRKPKGLNQYFLQL